MKSYFTRINFGKSTRDDDYSSKFQHQSQPTFVQPSTTQGYHPTGQVYQQHGNSPCQNIFDELVKSLNLMFVNKT